MKSIKHKVKKKVVEYSFKDTRWLENLVLLIACIVILFASGIVKADEIDIRTNIDDVMKVEMSTRECLVTNLYFESRSESDMANIMVLNSVFNRVKSEHYPNTPCKVIKQKSQYSWTKDNKSDKMLNLNQVSRLVKIVDKYLLNKELFLSLSEGSDHYHATSVTPDWSKSDRMVYIGTFDKHVFYRRK